MLGLVIISVVVLVLRLFFAALICRLILDWIQVLARQVIYTITDPPLKFLRRLLPPLSLGGVRLDLAFLVLMLSVSLTLGLLQ